jgi:hypothetical protein
MLCGWESEEKERKKRCNVGMNGKLASHFLEQLNWKMKETFRIFASLSPALARYLLTPTLSSWNVSNIIQRVLIHCTLTRTQYFSFVLFINTHCLHLPLPLQLTLSLSLKGTLIEKLFPLTDPRLSLSSLCFYLFILLLMPFYGWKASRGSYGIEKHIEVGFLWQCKLKLKWFLKCREWRRQVSELWVSV